MGQHALLQIQISERGQSYGPDYFVRNKCHYTTDAQADIIWKLGNSNFSTEATPIWAVHNTVLTIAVPDHQNWQGGGSANFGIWFFNNIYVGHNSYIFRGNPGGSGFAVSKWDYNDINGASDYCNTCTGFTPNASSSTLAQWTADGQDTHSITTDPSLNTTTLNISAGSVAIDKGVVLNNFNDANSAWPLSGAAPDIGAFEVGAACTPSKVVFTAQPASAAIGISLGSVSISIEDSGGNVCTSDTSTVTLTNSGGTCTGLTLQGGTSGAASAGIFTVSSLNETGMDLPAGGTSCTLTATDGSLTSAVSSSFTITDTTAPSCGPCLITSTNNTSTSLLLHWPVATDTDNTQSLLQYEVCQSGTSNISSVSGCEANLIQSFTTNITQLSVTGLPANFIWFYNVVVEDAAGNKTAYTSQQISLCASRETNYRLASVQRPRSMGTPCNPIR
jgi:hypothetical protein